MEGRRNNNPGYQQLRVWNSAVEHYVLTCEICRGFPYERKRIAGQAMASSDSAHRNIAKAYCRRSIHEYLNFLSIALGSLGESVSGMYIYHQAGQISQDEFDKFDTLAFKTENKLLRLVESLEHKRAKGDWISNIAE